MEEGRCICSHWVPSNRKSSDFAGSNGIDSSLWTLFVQLGVESNENSTTDLEWAFLMLACVDIVEACLGFKIGRCTSEPRDASLTLPQRRSTDVTFHGYGVTVITLELTLVLVSVSRSKFLVPSHAAARSVPYLREYAPRCARFHYHNFHTYSVWDIYRQLEWYVISL